MGSEPIEEEIPVEYEDLLNDVHEALNIYSKLRDEWDSMNGTYSGKNYSGILDILTLTGVEPDDRLQMYTLITLIDSVRKDVINKKVAAKQNSSKS